MVKLKVSINLLSGIMNELLKNLKNTTKEKYILYMYVIHVGMQEDINVYIALNATVK